MSKQEIMEKIAEVERKQFYLNMADHWDAEDYKTCDKYIAELTTLRNALKVMG